MRRLIASHVNVDCTPCEVGVTIDMVIGSIGVGKSLKFRGAPRCSVNEDMASTVTRSNVKNELMHTCLLRRCGSSSQL